MKTLQNIIPANIFSGQEFTQYAQKITRENTYNQKKYTTVGIITLIAIPLITAIAVYLLCARNPDMPTSLYYFRSILVGIITFAFSSIPVVFYMENRINTKNQPITSTWKNKYRDAWNTIIVPQMIYSISNFQKISDHLPEKLIKTPEYTQMYNLSEQVRQEIQQGAELTIHTKFDMPPSFIELDHMMNQYAKKYTA